MGDSRGVFCGLYAKGLCEMMKETNNSLTKGGGVEKFHAKL